MGRHSGHAGEPAATAGAIMKTWDGLIQAEELLPVLDRNDVIVVDCRFDLADPHAGERAWASAHLAGARYADLDRDLSDHRRLGHARHPLPEAAACCRRRAAWFISPAHQVGACDAGARAMAAERWWRWEGGRGGTE